jgi:UDP-2,3-diacylglucosamine pyrophosphatase LpxH
MNRRSAIGNLALTTLGMSLSGFKSAQMTKNLNIQREGSFSLNGHLLRFTHPGITNNFSITMLADTHLFKDDERGLSYTGFSGRMAKAYNNTKHFISGEPTNPEKAFVETLQVAQQTNAAILAMIGDILSFPSEAAVEWVKEELKKSGLNYVYTAGNHDWHYEGMEGTSDILRDTWIKKRLHPLYNGQNPYAHRREINGVIFITIDNSTYEINPEQLNLLHSCLQENKPCILLLHIPLYTPGRPVSFGCGHPQWNASNDKNFKLERRMPWRATGHTATTLAFYKTVFSAPNLMGILAGHIHQPSVDVVNGIPQVVAAANANGGYLQVSFDANHDYFPAQ